MNVCVVGKTFNHFMCCLGHRLSIKINQKLPNAEAKGEKRFYCKLITQSFIKLVLKPHTDTLTYTYRIFVYVAFKLLSPFSDPLFV